MILDALPPVNIPDIPSYLIKEEDDPENYFEEIEILDGDFEDIITLLEFHDIIDDYLSDE